MQGYETTDVQYDDDGIRVLEEKHMLSMILFLHRNGPVIKTVLRQSISKSPRFIDKLNALEDAGIVVLEDVISNRSTLISLTEKGERVAEHVLAIRDIIADSS